MRIWGLIGMVALLFVPTGVDCSLRRSAREPGFQQRDEVATTAGGGGGCIKSLDCLQGRACCGGRCVDLRTDPSNCGSCGNIVRGCCGGAPWAPVDDDNNCGSCGNACPAGEACRNGTCTCGNGILGEGDALCAAGQRCCGGPDPNDRQCVPTLTDPNHCGGCGDEGEVCPAFAACCHGVCSGSLAIDPENCGACDIECPQNEACVDGQCSCAGGGCPAGRCCSADKVCVDPKTDRANCGRCGQACAPGEDCCDGGCFNTRTDPRHCGSCAAGCAFGQTCVGGSCVFADVLPPVP
jgi:hypothetical protein